MSTLDGTETMKFTTKENKIKNWQIYKTFKKSPKKKMVSKVSVLLFFAFLLLLVNFAIIGSILSVLLDPGLRG